MGFYQFKREIELDVRPDTLWQFISHPSNLKKITPDYMMFDIISDNTPEEIYEGMIIRYIVSPVAGIKTQWVTEITHIKEKEYFIDEQRVGPYSMWHHQHFLAKSDLGTIMSDIISYKPPLGFLGTLANNLFISSKLNEIFDYREIVVSDLFGRV